MSDEVYKFTHKELREAIEAHVRPLEEKAFAAGVRAAEGAVKEQIRLESLVKNARASGVLSANSAAIVAGKSPEDLAKRANALQLEALAGGKELSNIEAVTAAYAEAGVPLR
jgi:hypothetical protein